jgi:DNA polymerase III delta prime subunit
MAKSIPIRLRDAVDDSQDLYHRLVLLVGPAGSGKSRQLLELAETCATRVINLNLALSGELLELTQRQRVLRIPVILESLAKNATVADEAGSPRPVILDNLEILFDTSLRQDPMRLLQALSRNRPVVVAWNGALLGRSLTYAERGHAEYRSYDDPDARIIEVDTITPER